MDIRPPLKYEILRKSIPNIKLHSEDGPYWYNSFGSLIKWSSEKYLDPLDGFIVYNISGSSLPTGYYIWTGETIPTNTYGDEGCDLSLELFSWENIPKSLAYDDNMLPLFLETTIDEMGVMVGFDGQIEQIEQICNFSYTQTGNTIQVYNTVDTSKVSELHNINFVVDWGDGTSSILSTVVTSVTKTYSSTGETTVSISINTPWTQFETKKKIQIPSDTTVLNPLGTFSGFTIPYTNITGQTQNYLNEYDNNIATSIPIPINSYGDVGCDLTLEFYIPHTGYTTFYYAAIGKSKISEKKLYGNDVYTGVTIGSLNGISYSAYTIDDLYYQDFEDGITTITGATSGFTKEEVINKLITRNEHFIGFIDEPVIYSDIFVERGKQGVLEKTLRLSEIDNTGELGIYGNGYFNIRKQ
jgi:hypothetical protein